MTKVAYTPWHEVVELRDDLRSGELTLSIFAADLYDVAMGRGRSVYRDPVEFFSLTYPTFNLRELAKDVMLRLAASNDKAIRQLELTYGGGKTHSLVTLYHLVNDPESLPDLPAVHEFRQHAGGMSPPRARVVVMPFDKLDVEKGMETRAPDGELRWLLHPWSVLAFGIAGNEGLRLLHAQDQAEERETPPAENLVQQLLEWPQRDGLATLVLIDEVLMYAREKVGMDPVWRHRLLDFFQALTQAATKVDRACVVASLLATDPRKSDDLGKEISQELYAIFRREREEAVQPVEKQDVAEVLRRRFFTPESIRDRQRFQAQVVSALNGIQTLDEWTLKNRQAEEERYLDSYPFHPDLTEALYTKWTQLEGFQRTRGVLRTFAMALRDAEKWDTSPLVGPNVLLGAEVESGLSEAARELASVAASEEYEGRRQEWSAILEGELAKAKDIQQEFPALRGRELEQAVMATFVHSQPVGQRALARELLVLLGAAHPDRIELEKALRRWTEVSWFLDESAFAESAEELPGAWELPKSWRLGVGPNMVQMHSQALTRVSPDLVDMQVEEVIRSERRLRVGVTQSGVRLHILPARPRDIEDDGDFHFAILGPKSASEPGRPSADAKRFLEETTSPDRPRTYRNALVLAAPARSGLDLLRDRVRDLLAWREVASLPEAEGFDDLRKALLDGYVKAARGRIPEAIVQAYNVVVTVSAKGEAEAIRITPDGETLFDTIKKSERVRIQESAISPEALLPEGPYNLWREGETSRRVSDLATAFAQFPHLPKMLRQGDIADTIAMGCEEGYFVLRLTRPDRSFRTIWRTRPNDADLDERDLGVVLPEAADLSDLDSGLLAPGALPGLWPDDGLSITVGEVISFFDGKHAVRVPREGYDDVFPVPRAPRDVVETAVGEAVRAGTLWLIAGPSSVFKEDIPQGLLTESAELSPPPEPIPATALLPQNLPAAWADATTTAAAVLNALSVEHGKPLPWTLVADAISAALRSRLLELASDSGAWPCEWPGASSVRLVVPSALPPPQPPPPPPGRRYVEAELEPAELVDFVDGLSEVIRAAAGLDLRLVLRLELSDTQLSEDQVSALNEALAKTGTKLRLG